ncbi:MAG: flagellar basal body-associated FliL family protein [Rhodospirillales bacterium]
MAKKPRKTNEKSGGGKLKKIIVVIVAVVILLGGGGAAAYFTGALDQVLGITDVDIVKEVPKQELALARPVYHDLPEFVADLRVTNDSRPPFLKLQLTVQIAEMDLPVLIEREPKIIDRVQRLLRNQTRLDLTGAEGSERLRADIVIIMNQTLDPAQVHNVLFRQMVLQ